MRKSYFKACSRPMERVGAKKADGTALTVTTQENAIKKTFDKTFAIPLDFDFQASCVPIWS